MTAQRVSSPDLSRDVGNVSNVHSIGAFSVPWVAKRGGEPDLRVLGVDPGLTRCGIGVVDGSAGRPLVAVHVEVLTTAPTDDLAARLLAISDGLDAAVARFRPDAVAVERVFAQQNLRTVTGTAQASGLAMVAASRHGVRVASHTPSEVKAAITGSGRADKAQVTAMVTRILKLETAPRPADAADALALAICHIWRGVAIARRDDAAVAARVARSGAARSRIVSATVLNMGENR